MKIITCDVGKNQNGAKNHVHAGRTYKCHTGKKKCFIFFPPFFFLIIHNFNHDVYNFIQLTANEPNIHNGKKKLKTIKKKI